MAFCEEGGGNELHGPFVSDHYLGNIASQGFKKVKVHLVFILSVYAKTAIDWLNAHS